jgi:hypothetical protein
VGTLLTIIVLAGCDPKTLESLTSKADGRVYNLKAEHDFIFRNDQPDYSLRVTMSVKNVGQSGVINITPWVTCSEGEWERSQQLHFNSGESNNLTFQFHELSINATNVQYGVRWRPNREHAASR